VQQKNVFFLDDVMNGTHVRNWRIYFDESTIAYRWRICLRSG